MARREPRPQANQDERLEPQRTTCIECEQPDVGHEVLWVIREVLLGEIVREAAQPIYEADRHAKKSGSKQVRGIRPIERSLEGQTDEETQAVRDYYLAVRSALTDDRYPPLCASGWRLQRILTKGLLATEGAWEPLKQVYGWIHQLAQVLDETEEMQVEDQIPDLPRTNNDREQTFEQVRAHERMATMS